MGIAIGRRWAHSPHHNLVEVTKVVVIRSHLIAELLRRNLLGLSPGLGSRHH
jgi:hypothetical protein